MCIIVTQGVIVTKIISLTPEQKRGILSTINNKRFYVETASQKGVVTYKLINNLYVAQYSIDKYSNGRRVVWECGDIIADSDTFGHNVALVHEIDFIIGLLIDKHNRDAKRGRQR